MLFLNLPLKSADGIAVEHHKIAGAQFSADFAELAVNVQSWPSEEERLAGRAPVARLNVGAPVAALDLSAGLVPAVLAAVLASEWFAGATVVPDKSQGLDAAKARKWAEIQAARDAAVAAPVNTVLGPVDGSAVGRARLLTASVFAMQEVAAGGKPDDATVPLRDRGDVAQLVTPTAVMQAFREALMVEEGLRQVADLLRVQIDLAEDESALALVVWPSQPKEQ